jgi:hypothetical protein
MAEHKAKMAAKSQKRPEEVASEEDGGDVDDFTGGPILE